MWYLVVLLPIPIVFPSFPHYFLLKGIEFQFQCRLSRGFLDEKKYFLQMPKMGDLQINKFVLGNILSSRMNSRELTYAYGAIFKMSGFGGKRALQPYWLRMSGTPLNETIFAAMTPKEWSCTVASSFEVSFKTTPCRLSKLLTPASIVLELSPVPAVLVVVAFVGKFAELDLQVL